VRFVLQNPATTEQVKKLPRFREPEISLPCSQDPVTVPCPEFSPSHIWPSIYRSLKLSFSFRLNDRLFCSFPLSATRATCTAQSHLLHFTSLIILCEEWGLWSSHYLQFSCLLLWPLCHVVIFIHYRILREFILFFLGWQTRFCIHRKQKTDNYQCPMSYSQPRWYLPFMTVLLAGIGLRLIILPCTPDHYPM
jgi:hypothetical protein